MKNSPGNSLFQNTLFQNGFVDAVAKEELEAEQDKIRLQKELNEDLERVFGSVDNCDDEASSYSASVSANYNNISSIDKILKAQRSNDNSPARIDNSPNDAASRQHYKDCSNPERLEVLYNVRVRENEQLRNEIESLKKKSELERMEIFNSMKQAQIEVEKMTASRDEIQSVLVETTARLRETEKELNTLKHKHMESESVKQNALHELEMCQAMIRDNEKRLLIAEKNTYKNEEANFDCVLKELTSNHKKEVTSLQKNINNLTSKLNANETKYLKLEQQLLDQKRMHESVLREKRDTIEKLNAKLNEYPRQYHGDIESLKKEITLLKSENQELMMQLNNTKQEQELLKVTFMDNVTKLDMLHKEELSELELTYSKKILELEAQLKEMENNTKNNILKVYADEIDKISMDFVGHFDTLNDTIEKLRTELEIKMKQLALSNKTIEKLHLEIDKIYQKYVNIRKSAFTLKEQLNSRTELLHRRHQQYVTTMKEIQKYLDDALHPTNTGKLSQFIEKSLKSIDQEADFRNNGITKLRPSIGGTIIES